MRIVIVAIIVIALSTPCFCQSWQSARLGTSTMLDSVFENGSYIWTFRNVSGQPGDGTIEYDVLAWTLQPFNIPAPSNVTAPEGWVWISSGGWSRFELADKNRKFNVGGPALEPGESLVFTYTPASDSLPVNSGGPDTGLVSYITHTGAVIPGHNGSKWSSPAYLDETQWHEIVNIGSGNMAPEPSGILALLVGCAGLIRAFRSSGSRSL